VAWRRGGGSLPCGGEGGHGFHRGAQRAGPAWARRGRRGRGWWRGGGRRGQGGGGGGGGEREGARSREGGGGGGGRGLGAGAESFGFYLPFNWRGLYDFGSGLTGDWGVHILGPANWALQLHPKHLISVECIKKNTLPPFTFPDELTIKYEFAARGSMPPVTVY